MIFQLEKGAKSLQSYLVHYWGSFESLVLLASHKMTEPVSPAHGIERFSNEPLTAARGTESVKGKLRICFMISKFRPGVGKLFSRRAALTIKEWSRARACCLVQLHAIKEIALAQNFAICPCNVVSQDARTVVSLKKKGASPFRRQ